MAYSETISSGTYRPPNYTAVAEDIRPAPNIELAAALSDLREVAAEAAKACEEYLVARDRWFYTRGRLDDLQSKVGALREQHDR